MTQLLPMLAQQQDGGTFFGVLGCVFLLIGLAVFAFWLWMLVDALTNEPTTNDRILWFIVIFFLNLVGALIYLFVRKIPRGTQVQKGPPA